MTTDYTEQTWHDDDPATPVSAARLGHIEDGIKNHGHPDIEAEIAAGGGGGGGGGGGAIAAASLWVAGGLETLSSGGWASNPLTSLSDDSGGADLSWDVSDPQRIIVHTPGVYAITLYFRSSAVPASQKARLTISSSTPHVDDIADERAFGTDAGTVYAALTYIVPMPADALTEVGGTGWLYANVGLAGADLANSSMEIIVTKLVGVLAGGGGGGGVAAASALLMGYDGSQYSDFLYTSDGDVFTPGNVAWGHAQNANYGQNAGDHNGTIFMVGSSYTGGSDRPLAISADGRVLRRIPSALGAAVDGSEGGAVHAVCWDATNNQWVIGGLNYNNTVNLATGTPDGSTWTARPNPFDGYAVLSICEHAGTLLAVIDSGNYSDPDTGDYLILMRSTDAGVTWTIVPIDPPNMEDNTSTVYSVQWVHDRFFLCTDNGAGGPGLRFSTDNGDTWTQIVAPDPAQPLGYQRVAYGAGKFLAVAAQAWATGTLIESTDGEAATWSDVSSRLVGTGGEALRHITIAWVVDRFILANNGGMSGYELVVSPNGVDWESRWSGYVGQGGIRTIVAAR